MEVTASAAAFSTAGGWPGGREARMARASRSPRVRRVATAARRAGSGASGVARRAAARACCMVVATEVSFSAASARSRAGRAVVSRDLKTASAASARVLASGEKRRRAPIAASSERRTALLRRTGRRFAASGAGSPVSASSCWVSVLMMGEAPGRVKRRPAWRASRMGAARGLPEVARASMPWRTSSKLPPSWARPGVSARAELARRRSRRRMRRIVGAFGRYAVGMPGAGGRWNWAIATLSGCNLCASVGS